MYDLQQLNPGELIAVVSIVGGLVCGTVTIAAHYYRQIRRDEILAKLKTDMLDRGMTAAEIQTVLEAGTVASDQ
ncbi:MAG: hypothetical protein DCC67_11145 [Planctomycetota bacterium]|nr:MAG: hypothetical protein DCC67_11145 [Planctomycetota bacterium]